MPIILDPSNLVQIERYLKNVHLYILEHCGQELVGRDRGYARESPDDRQIPGPRQKMGE